MAYVIDKEKCNCCLACVPECPADAIKIEDGYVTINNECINCGICVNECSQEAISES